MAGKILRAYSISLLDREDEKVSVGTDGDIFIDKENELIAAKIKSDKLKQLATTDDVVLRQQYLQSQIQAVSEEQEEIKDDVKKINEKVDLHTLYFIPLYLDFKNSKFEVGYERKDMSAQLDLVEFTEGSTQEVAYSTTLFMNLNQDNTVFSASNIDSKGSNLIWECTDINNPYDTFTKLIISNNG